MNQEPAPSAQHPEDPGHPEAPNRHPEDPGHPEAPNRHPEVPGLFDLGLAALAVAYLVFVGVSGVGSDFYSSADQVADGEVWRLFTSALNVVTTLDTVQWVLLAGVVGLTMYRLGPRIWWVVALAGHVGSAIISYAVIELAVALDSNSAISAAAESDYGISIVLAATLGALTAGVLQTSGKDVPMNRGDRLSLGVGLAGLLGMIAVSYGWYDVQHLIGYTIGFLLAGYLAKKSRWVGFHG